MWHHQLQPPHSITRGPGLVQGQCPSQWSHPCTGAALREDNVWGSCHLLLPSRATAKTAPTHQCTQWLLQVLVIFWNRSWETDILQNNVRQNTLVLLKGSKSWVADYIEWSIFQTNKILDRSCDIDLVNTINAQIFLCQSNIIPLFNYDLDNWPYVASWSLYAACTMEPSVKTLYVQNFLLKASEQDQSIQEAATKVVKEGMARLSQHLKHSDYICGNR